MIFIFYAFHAKPLQFHELSQVLCRTYSSLNDRTPENFKEKYSYRVDLESGWELVDCWQLPDLQFRLTYKKKIGSEQKVNLWQIPVTIEFDENDLPAITFANNRAIRSGLLPVVSRPLLLSSSFNVATFQSLASMMSDM